MLRSMSRRRTETERNEVLEQLKHSGKSRSAFCREHGLCYLRHVLKQNIPAMSRDELALYTPQAFARQLIEQENTEGWSLDGLLPASQRVNLTFQYLAEVSGDNYHPV